MLIPKLPLYWVRTKSNGTVMSVPYRCSDIIACFKEIFSDKTIPIDQIHTVTITKEEGVFSGDSIGTSEEESNKCLIM